MSWSWSLSLLLALGGCASVTRGAAEANVAEVSDYATAQINQRNDTGPYASERLAVHGTG
jgi:uncharacterized protein YceK